MANGDNKVPTQPTNQLPFSHWPPLHYMIWMLWLKILYENQNKMKNSKLVNRLSPPQRNARSEEGTQHYGQVQVTLFDWRILIKEMKRKRWWEKVEDWRYYTQKKLSYSLQCSNVRPESPTPQTFSPRNLML